MPNEDVGIFQITTIDDTIANDAVALSDIAAAMQRAQSVTIIV